MNNTRKHKKNLLRAVPVAWPTLLLAVAAIGCWIIALTLGVLGTVPVWLAGGLSCMATFVAFTPMHDASHRALTTKRTVNEVIGRLVAIPLTAPFAAFRYVHLEHHKHTNHAAMDPDMWSGRGPSFLLPLRWLSQDWYYYYAYLRVAKTRPRSEVVEIVASLVLLYGAIVVLTLSGFGMQVFFLWVLPSRLALALLAFAFDYLPHHPHQIEAKENRFAATVIREQWWLTCMLLYQNYHLVHHLYPGVPFYRYAKVWRSRRTELIGKGARVL